MKVTALSATLALFLISCTSSRPMVSEVPPASERAGSVQSFPLVEYRHGLFGSTEARSEGVLEVSPDYIVWVVDGSDMVALRSAVISEVWLNCAQRPGDNLCLELGFTTLTGDRYWFRDRDWRAGGNRQILALFDYLQANYPSAKFDRNSVESVR
jgi:hypothetical protein